METHKSIFLDIDGTLTIDGKGPFDDDVKEIQGMRRQGHKVFLNTGRSLASIPVLIRDAEWVDGIIAAGGAHILIKNNDRKFDVIQSKCISLEMLDKICAFYLAGNKTCLFEGEETLYGIHWKDKNVLVSEIYCQDDFRHKYHGAAISKITMSGLISVEEQDLFGDYFSLFQHNGFCEGILKGASKGSGMKTVLEKLGASIINSIAIGDSPNDLEMIRTAGTGIAMGNACAELKAAAKYTTAGCGQGGVAQALRYWV